MVPKAGLEPAHPKAVDFESTASTNSATPARSDVFLGKRSHYTCLMPSGNIYLEESDCSIKKKAPTKILQ